MSISWLWTNAARVADAFLNKGIAMNDTRTALTFGAFTGLNDYESYRASTGLTFLYGTTVELLNIFMDNIFFAKLGPIEGMPEKFGTFLSGLRKGIGSLASVPKSAMTWNGVKGFFRKHSSKIIWSGVNGGSSLAILTGGELWLRKGINPFQQLAHPINTFYSVGQLFEDPNFQLNFWTSLICDATLGFYAADRKTPYLDLVFVMSAASSFSSFMAQVVLDEEHDLNSVNYHRVQADYAYVGTISVFKMKKVFMPAGTMMTNYTAARFAGSPKIVRLLDVGIKFSTAFASNSLGNPTYTFIMKTLMEEKEYFRQVNEVYYDEFQRMKKP
jgi:hypothetical protein